MKHYLEEEKSQTLGYDNQQFNNEKMKIDNVKEKRRKKFCMGCMCGECNSKNNMATGIGIQQNSSSINVVIFSGAMPFVYLVFRI